MTTFREKYSYAVDRHVGGFWYRFQSEFEIRRSSVGCSNFLPWQEFTNPGDTRRTWRKLCDQSEQRGSGIPAAGPTKETT